MSLTLANALRYVNQHVNRLKNPARLCAVSDYANYNDWITPPITTMAEYQKTWALYLKWTALSKADHRYGSPNGGLYMGTMLKKFWYTEGGNALIAPTLHPGRPNPMPGLTFEVELKGVGQCEYFATQAYQALRAGGPVGTVPCIEKVSTPGHNWVLVNRSPLGNQADWIAVDLWLFAMGVPATQCICAWTNANPQFGPPNQVINVVESFNPHNEP